MEEQKRSENSDKAKESVRNHADVSGPIMAWLIVLFVALAIKLFFSGTYLSTIGGGFISVLLALSNFILFLPGSLILPLLVGATIGTEVGLSASKMSSAQKGGILNGVYTALVYVIAIVIIYEALINILPSQILNTLPFTSRPQFFMYYWILYPIIIIIALCEVFAIMSYSRKVAD